jgi:hypothetical protein
MGTYFAIQSFSSSERFTPKIENIELPEVETNFTGKAI